MRTPDTRGAALYKWRGLDSSLRRNPFVGVTTTVVTAASSVSVVAVSDARGVTEAKSCRSFVTSSCDGGPWCKRISILLVLPVALPVVGIPVVVLLPVGGTVDLTGLPLPFGTVKARVSSNAPNKQINWIHRSMGRRNRRRLVPFLMGSMWRGFGER
jgi:hypothetical protein